MAVYHFPSLTASDNWVGSTPEVIAFKWLLYWGVGDSYVKWFKIGYFVFVTAIIVIQSLSQGGLFVALDDVVTSIGGTVDGVAWVEPCCAGTNEWDCKGASASLLGLGWSVETRLGLGAWSSMDRIISRPWGSISNIGAGIGLWILDLKDLLKQFVSFLWRSIS